jgi:hypothetical protein
LQHRTIPSANGVLEQGLIHWSGWPREMATWENLAHLRQAFPHALAWGQAGPQEPGNVSSNPPVATSSEAAHGLKTGARIKKPNVRLAGPEWA